MISSSSGLKRAEAIASGRFLRTGYWCSEHGAEAAQQAVRAGLGGERDTRVRLHGGKMNETLRVPAAQLSRGDASFES